MKPKLFAELLGATTDVLAHAKGKKKLRTTVQTPSHLNTKQAAHFANVSQPAITKALQDGRLPFIKLYGVKTKMIPVAALRRWMRARAKAKRRAS